MRWRTKNRLDIYGYKEDQEKRGNTVRELTDRTRVLNDKL